MQIKEVEDLLQMTSYSLRYYERMGLIHPERDENGYRNYSNEDIQSLKKIRFLRELEIPIENIEGILNNSISFQEILEKHIKTLSTQIKSLGYVQSVCKDLKDKQIPLLDAMTDEIIINNESIDKNKMVFGLNKVVEYLKPPKTIV
ncbi:MAG: MerR family transcriptional regulator, partial [Coprobacillus sp.]